MAEIRTGDGSIKTIAYYLPQFHAITENDKAWGEGFTEWVNTKKAEPQFENHYQPKTPLNENYYDLTDVNVMIEQAALAKKYSLFGFCYYHYWFKNGKKLLEKPVEQMLKEPKVDMPFCFSWANENWSKLWDGGNRELIVEQDYGDETDWAMHLEYLVDFFKDPRYITLDGKPILLIYKPEIIPRVQEMLAFWKKKITEYGLPGICFLIQSPGLFYSPSYYLGEFEYQIKFPPFFSIVRDSKDMDKLKKQQKLYSLFRKAHLDHAADKAVNYIKSKRESKRSAAKKSQTILEYDKTWETLLNSEHSPEMVEGALVDWDNTARKLNGYVHVGASPQKFEQYMKQLVEIIKESDQQPMIFINAWNEWAEGAYLEPDTLHEYGYLQALKNAMEE